MDTTNRMTRTFAMTTLLLLLVTAFAGTANAQRDTDREMTQEICEESGKLWAEDRQVCYEETREGETDKDGWEEREHFDERECLALRERIAQMDAGDEGYDRIIEAMKSCFSSSLRDEHRGEDVMKRICARFTPDRGDWNGKDWDWNKDEDWDWNKDQDRETSTEGRQSDERETDEREEHDEREDERRGDRDGAHMRTMCRRMSEKLDDKLDLDRPDMQRLSGLCKRMKEYDYSNKEIDAEEAGILTEKCRMIADKFAKKDDNKRDNRVQQLRERVSDEVSRDRADDRVDDRDDRMKDLRERADSLRDRLDRESDENQRLGPRDYVEDSTTVSLR